MDLENILKKILQNFCKLIAFVLLFNLGLPLKSQNLPVPLIRYVSVLNDSTVKISWYSDTNNINGFIIKRLILDGQGVVHGTFNNIEIISEPSLFSYIDTSTDYHTFSKPYQRSETYKISTFKTSNDSVFFSLPSQPHQTLFLTGSYDVCDTSVYLKWNPYKNRDVLKYLIQVSNTHKIFYFQTTDTLYSFKISKPNDFYKIKIIAILKQNSLFPQDSSFSNSFAFFSLTSIPPDTLYIYNVSVVDTSLVKFKILVSSGKRIKNLYVISDSDTLSAFPYNQDSLSITISPQTTFYISVLDSCNQTIKISNIIKPIYLSVRQENNKIFLKWNAFKGFADKDITYEVYAYANNDIIFLGTTEDTAFQEDLKNILSVDTITKIYFRIKSQEKKNPYGIENITLSNKAQLILQPIIYTPNCLKFNAINKKDRLFIPQIKFVKNYKLTIFSTDGKIVFETQNLNEYWDGYFKGKKLPQGIYQFYIEVLSLDNKKIIKKGSVILME